METQLAEESGFPAPETQGLALPPTQPLPGIPTGYSAELYELPTHEGNKSGSCPSHTVVLFLFSCAASPREDVRTRAEGTTVRSLGS